MIFFRRKRKPPAKAAPPAEKRQGFFTTDIDGPTQTPAPLLAAAIMSRAIPTPAPQSVAYDSAAAHATDEAMSGLKAQFAAGRVVVPEAQAWWYASQSFIGYQMCAVLAQHWLIAKACHTPARDAVRKGYEITANDGQGVAPDVLAAVNKANKRYKLNKHLVDFAYFNRVFGIRVALCVVESDDEEYYVKPFNPDGILPGKYRGIVQIDPYWCVPELTSASATNPAAPGFYEPTYWQVNAQRIHKSHLVIIRGPEVADILKPSYLYGGVSLTQRIYERVYAAERTANEAPLLAQTKRLTTFYTDAAQALANQEQFETSLATWASYRDNHSIKVADKEAEKIEQTDTSLGDLDDVIMSQYQLVAAIANVPVSKLFGTTPKGFNSTGDYEESNYHEELESTQTDELTPLIERHLLCVMRSDVAPRFGIDPVGLDVAWEPLDSMTAKEAAEVQLVEAQTAKIYAVDIGAIDNEEVRERLIADEKSGYNGFDSAHPDGVD